jgi:hypothetical protein
MKKLIKKHIFLAAVTILISLIIYAPHFLTYATDPSKSDVIVVFYGPDFEARIMEAKRLIANSCSNYIMIPYLEMTNPVSEHGSLALFTSPTRDGRVPLRHHYEETHVELLMAKEMMDKAGFQSANLVSSPYHMRRIKIISEKVFSQGNTKFSFVPTKYVKTYRFLWFLSKYDIHNIVSEYLKIIWFMLYDSFGKSG